MNDFKISHNELFLIFTSRLLSKDLHYALTNDEKHPDYTLAELIKAQANYRSFILNQVDDVLDQDTNKNILEVGPGTGQIMLELLSKGYKVRGVMPSEALADECYKNFKNANIQQFDPIFTCPFESLKTHDTYDLIIFSESFQYIPDDVAFSLCSKLLNPNGNIIILDCFFKELYDEKNPETHGLKGGHPIQLVEKSIEKYNFQIIKKEDLTKRTSYTMGIRQELFGKFVSIPWKQYFSSSYPGIYRFLLYLIYLFIRKKVKHMVDETIGGSDTQNLVKNYEQYKRYMLYVLKKN